jgi:chemotaxis protein histidine kinase CheA
LQYTDTQKLMHTARKLEDTLDIVNEELPGLSASARLTGLELADCIVEFSNLGREVTGGLKAGARAMQATEASLQEGGRALKHTWKKHIVPGINERVTASKGVPS